MLFCNRIFELKFMPGSFGKSPLLGLGQFFRRIRHGFRYDQFVFSGKEANVFPSLS